VVAVDPRVVNLGSNVYVPGYGEAVAGDTGGRIKGKRIDLGYPDGAIEGWYRWVDVYLLTPVPPASQMNVVLPDTPVERKSSR
jgi:3D (Asp-Asp-Asp) domain-containing protein